ncbi:Protein-tyrosine phosphatase [Dictyocaulus viviparus]|uniref:Protein-tyrosine phosphatase n=1 Tax=Dictyocaulus viviparus TaxID=29172 RepID=A0A0D8XJS2_DICVI|nr:Protein-tyrosine phosphatase [Dictyocaulus viviparus]
MNCSERQAERRKRNTPSNEVVKEEKAKSKARGSNEESKPVQQPRQSKASEVVTKWVMRALDTGVDALRAEYRSLARYTLPDVTYEAFKANHEAGKNRYQDVPCQDQHRVVLTWPGAPCDYIHANYVGTPLSDKRFICTQDIHVVLSDRVVNDEVSELMICLMDKGPLDGTIIEFWMMVLQEESQTIVMLCNCIETGKYKCSEYWPNQVGMTKTFAGIDITNVQMRPMSPEEQTVIVSVLFVRFTRPDGNAEQREVRHYQWTDWPDRGVPPCKLTSMELLSRIRGTTKPIIVHCSAGIGRTGTIVAIEYILERMQAGVECAAMNDLLRELRNQRAYTIQNDLQYLFIHRVMLCYFLERHRQRYESILTEENQAKYKKFVEDYNQATGTNN